jgi:hypothetical protein
MTQMKRHSLADKKIKPTRGNVIVHNSTRDLCWEDDPAAKYTMPPAGSKYVVCSCAWRPDLGAHYRVNPNRGDL